MRRWEFYPGPLKTLQSTGPIVQLLRTKRPLRAGLQPEEKRHSLEKRQLNSRGFSKRVHLVDQQVFEDEEDDDYMVLTVGGKHEAKPYYMEGFINAIRLKAMIGTGSPVTIFALEEIERFMKREKQLIESECFVDFNGKPLQPLGFVFCELQVNDSYIKKARILIARSGSKSIIGREWLTILRFKLEAEKSELEVNSIEKENELSPETKQLVNDFPNIFKRQGKVINYQKN